MKRTLAFALCIMMLLAPLCSAAESGLPRPLLFDIEGNPRDSEGNAYYAGVLRLTLESKGRPGYELKNDKYIFFGVECDSFDGYAGTDDHYHLYARLSDPFAIDDARAAFAKAAGVIDVDFDYVAGYAWTSPYAVKRGDVDGNGKLEAYDYAMAKRAVLGNYTISEGLQTYRADANNDGEVTSTDYAMIKRAVLGNYYIESAVKFENGFVSEYLKREYSAYYATESTEGLYVASAYYGYGKYSDMFLASIVGASEFPDDAELYEYEGKRFAIAPNSGIFDGEKFYTVEEAYKAGLLDEFDIMDFMARFGVEEDITPTVILK